MSFIWDNSLILSTLLRKTDEHINIQTQKLVMYILSFFGLNF